MKTNQGSPGHDLIQFANKICEPLQGTI